MRALLGSRLAELYALEVIPTYDRPEPLKRLAYFLRGTCSLVRWCLRRGPRIVHIHTTVRGSLYRKSMLVALSKLLRRPVVLHLHAGTGDIGDFDARIGPVRRAIFARVFRAADRILSVSDASAREIERRLGCTGVLVVPNAAPPTGAAKAVGVSPDGERVKILYLGGFANQAKGGEILARALPDLVSNCPDVEVTLAGPGEPLPALRRLIGDGRVRWCGWLDEQAKAREFARSDIFVLPSVSEGLPVALLEAMSWGRAIVATKVGGVPEVLSEGIEALLVEPRRPDELARKLSSLAADGSARARLGSAARARARRLNEDEFCGRLDALYRELV